MSCLRISAAAAFTIAASGATAIADTASDMAVFDMAVFVIAAFAGAASLTAASVAGGSARAPRTATTRSSAIRASAAAFGAERARDGDVIDVTDRAVFARTLSCVGDDSVDAAEGAHNAQNSLSPTRGLTAFVVAFFFTLGWLAAPFPAAADVDACCWPAYCDNDVSLGGGLRCNQCVGVDENGGCPASMITARCPNSTGNGCWQASIRQGVGGLRSTPPRSTPRLRNNGGGAIRQRYQGHIRRTN